MWGDFSIPSDYVSWAYFCWLVQSLGFILPGKWRISLVGTLTYQPLVMYLGSGLGGGVKFVTGTLCSSGFPESVVRSVVMDGISDFCGIGPDSVQGCPVCLGLPWLGDGFAGQISVCVRRCSFSSNLRVVFHVQAVLVCAQEYVLRPQQSSSLICSFGCVCVLQYIGRTNQCLDSRIKQHVLTKIWQGNYFADWINNTYGASFAEHLINNCNCASLYIENLFTILSKSHSDFHLKVLETIHILTYKPSLCKQRKCLLGLNLIIIWFTPSFSKQLESPPPPLHYTVLAPCPFLIVLNSAVISKDQNGLVVKFYFL